MLADSCLEHIAREPAVAERLVADLGCQLTTELGQAPVAQVVVGFGGHLCEDLGELVVGVVLEFDLSTEPARQSGVLGDEGGHGGGVARDDDDQVVAVVLHLLHEGVDGLFAILVAIEGIGLVDKQHPADGLADHFGGLHGGLAEVTRHQFRTVHLNQLALAEQADGLVDPGDHAGDRGLAGPRIAGEDQVTGDGGALESGLGAQRVDAQNRRLAPNLRLDAG